MEDSAATKDKGKEKDVDDSTYKIKIPHGKRPFNSRLFGSTVQKGFAQLWNDTLLSDLTLVLGDEKIPVHRLVLSVWSETFRAMLDNDTWKESQLRELPIQLEQEDHEHFKNLLKHMYTGETDFINGQNVLPLISLSNYYGVHSLKEICGTLLGDLVSDENLFFFLDIVDKYDVKSLEAACGEHLAENFGDLMEEGKLNDLEPTTWAEMLKSNELQLKSEEQLFEAVLRYADQFKDEPEKRDNALNTILPYVRFPLFSPKFLVQVVEAEASIQHLDVVRDLLHEAYRYKVSPTSVQTIRTQPRFGFRFDKDQCNSSITLSDDNMKATCQTTAWVNVRCQHPLNPGHDYMEFKVESGSTSHLMLGVVSGGCSNVGYAGQYSNGWTYYSSGQVYNSSSTPATGQAYSTGDKIGVKYDFTKNLLIFYKNGTQVATLNGVTVSATTPLYPIASMNGIGTCVSVATTGSFPSGTGDKKKKKSVKSLSAYYGDQSAKDDDTQAASSSSTKDNNSGASFIRRFLKF